MIIKEYQQEELKQARKLQEECVNLHLACPPLLHWDYTIQNNSGQVIEKGKGKANSYTRNALNSIAYHAGLVARDVVVNTTVGDGIVNLRETSGTIRAADSGGRPYFRYFSYNPILHLGFSEEEENLDYYEDATLVGLYGGSTNTNTGFDVANRKLITQITKTYINNELEPVTINEACVTVQNYAVVAVLYIRDIFTPITLDPANTIIWSYHIEVLYPE